ncbi:uncharacterized protein DUF4128 [Buttiauxella sp. BIGb0552]|uniref:phage tail terminator-like protein n=1 Tax=Buttiauxella sp. BIGb0552 TaxID=2485120 RepID=UPI001066A451|nr:phage tail terminator-like protein [Buttiauxella sp. BIGb0552]TDX14858.1 uncharacterized protein DUF4128 [Buttiauxella sp. BIGb0552]
MADQSLRIVEILEQRIAVVASAQEVLVAWENIPFTPPQDKPYLRVFVLPATTQSLDFEAKAQTYRGILQVNVIAMSGNGVGESRSLAQLIADEFPEGRHLPDGELSVYISGQPTIHPGIQDRTSSGPTGGSGSISYTIPISISYRADY